MRENKNPLFLRKSARRIGINDSLLCVNRCNMDFIPMAHFNVLHNFKCSCKTSEQRIMGQEPFCCSGNDGILFRFKIVSSRIAECRFDGMSDCIGKFFQHMHFFLPFYKRSAVLPRSYPLIFSEFVPQICAPLSWCFNRYS